MKKIYLCVLAITLYCVNIFGISSCVHQPNTKKPFSDLIFPVTDLSTGKTGYMDVNGKIIIKPDYDYAYELIPEWDGLLQVGNYKNGDLCFGLIDKTNNVIFPIQYELLIYDPSNKTIIASKTVVFVFMSGLPILSVGYYKLDGTVILPDQYRFMSKFINGKAIVQKSDDFHWYIIDEKGEVIKKLDESITYAWWNMYHTDYIAFSRTYLDEYLISKYGYMDTEGKVLFELPYQSLVTEFENGRAIIQDVSRNIICVIDTEGNVIKELGMSYYAYINGFKDGIALVSMESGLMGAVNSDGDWVIEPEYKQVDYNNGVITAQVGDSHYVFFDKAGKTILERNDPCTYYKDGYFFALKDDRFYMQDINGNTIMQLPEGYMPVRRSFSNTIWNQWTEKHTKTHD